MAVKCIQLAQLDATAQKRLGLEIEIMKKCDHPHIVHLLDFYWDKRCVYLVMEWCGLGDLSVFMRRGRAGVLPESLAKTFMRQLASALYYLHKHDTPGGPTDAGKQTPPAQQIRPRA